MLTLWAQHLVKSGRYEAATSLTLSRLQKYREQADYSRAFIVDESSARSELAAAKTLVARVPADLGT